MRHVVEISNCSGILGVVFCTTCGVAQPYPGEPPAESLKPVSVRNDNQQLKPRGKIAPP
jgi:hypothetical protein